MARSGNDQQDGRRLLREAANGRLMADVVARRARGELRPGDVREAARRAGVGERTLWRWIAAGRPLERGRQARSGLR